MKPWGDQVWKTQDQHKKARQGMSEAPLSVFTASGEAAAGRSVHDGQI